MLATVLVCSLGVLAGVSAAPQDQPNLVVIFCDDLGYGDLGCFGHPTIRTPHLDRMAREGMKWTSFYSAAPICTPSRAALLTGRLPIRSGMCSDKRGVLFPDSGGGIPQSEWTLAEMLRERGYATCCVGKWHLGHLPPYLPTRHGFDEYLGVPYSNDMTVKKRNDPPLPLMKDAEVIESGVDQRTLTRRYTEHAVDFIRRSKDRRFFLYFPHTFPHIPLFASEAFRGESPRGLYGDVVEEIDWSVGRILDTLRELGLAANTLVWFTSDNGPWLPFKQRGGSAGLLRDGKGTTWEGGVREPTIAWWPGTVPAGTTTQEIGSTLDLLPTMAALCGAELPDDREYDGHDLTAALQGTGPSPRESMFYYRGVVLHAVRHGPFKLHFFTGRPAQRKAFDPPRLFRLDRDPGEQYPLKDDARPDVRERIAALAAAHRASLRPVENQLEKPLPGR